MKRRATTTVLKAGSGTQGRHEDSPASAASDSSELYVLISFSPWYGIGLFEYCRVRHVFDLSPTAGGGGFAARLNVALSKTEQRPAQRQFETLRQLLVCCRQQFLQEQKDGWYSILFTSHLAKQPSESALTLLDERELCQFSVSRPVISLLRHVAIPNCVAESIINANRCDLRNVKVSLASELWELVSCRRVEAALKNLSTDAPRMLAELRSIRKALSDLEIAEEAV